MYELVNVFDSFLPQLLTYPNPADPLNPEAANLLNHSPQEYKSLVAKLVLEHALPKGLTTELVREQDSEAGGDRLKKTVLELKAGDDMECEIAGETEPLSPRSDLSALSETSDICDEDL